MRLLFYYTSVSSAGLPSKHPDSFNQPTQHPLLLNFHTEGLAWLLERMLAERMVDEYAVILESAHSPGKGKLANGMPYYTYPHINDTLPILRPDDVIWARGGFRSWPPFLEQMNKDGRWVLFYRAATNRGGWPYWDIVLDDLIEENRIDTQGRLQFAFHKPVRPEYFKPDYARVPDFDIMLNASHIHDRKGQYKGVQAAIAYQELTGQKLRVLLPGSTYRGHYTNQIPEWIARYQLLVEQPGMVPRSKVGGLMNRCKLYVHLGGGGQNDRGALEALRCGLPPILAMPEYFPPFVRRAATVITDHNNPQTVARVLLDKLKHYRTEWKQQTAEHYERHNGDAVALNKMRDLFSFLRAHPRAQREVAAAHFAAGEA